MNLRTANLLKLHGLYQEEANDGDGNGGSHGGGGDGGAGGEGDGKPAGSEEGKGGEGDGKPKPSDQEAKLLKEVMEKKEKLTKASQELNELKQKLAKLDELGGLDQIAALVAEKKEAETKQLEAKGEWDRLKARMAEENSRVVKEKDEKLSEAQKQINALMEQINELTVGSSFSQSKFISEELIPAYSPVKVRRLYGEHFDMVDGKVVGYDKPRGAANRTPLVDGSGNPVGFDEALRKIVEADPDKDQMLRSKMKPGAGSDTRRAEPARKQEFATGVDRIAAGLQKLAKGG